MEDSACCLEDFGTPRMHAAPASANPGTTESDSSFLAQHKQRQVSRQEQLKAWQLKNKKKRRTSSTTSTNASSRKSSSSSSTALFRTPNSRSSSAYAQSTFAFASRQRRTSLLSRRTNSSASTQKPSSGSGIGEGEATNTSINSSQTSHRCPACSPPSGLPPPRHRSSGIPTSLDRTTTTTSQQQRQRPGLPPTVSS